MRSIYSLCILPIAFLCIAFIQAPRNPITRADSDDKFAVLEENLTYKIGNSDLIITVPDGFVTDYASIPPGISILLPRHGRYSRAAMIHDYLYWTQICTRRQSDYLLVLAMKESGVPAWKVQVILKGLRAGGGLAWKANARERQSGGIRNVPAAYRKTFGEQPWAGTRALLMRMKTPDIALPADTRFCAAGNSTEIPN